MTLHKILNSDYFLTLKAQVYLYQFGIVGLLNIDTYAFYLSSSLTHSSRVVEP